MLETVLLVLEIIGTISFAVSGTFVAIRKCLDIFGVVFIGCITAVGGGILRDLLIGITPPAIFSNLYILLIAAFSAIITFVFAYIVRDKFTSLSNKIEHINNLFDALGLAAFSVMGTEIAFMQGLSGNIPLSILLGMLTGCGGGMIRDVLTSNTPYIFKKHVYALASIGGAVLYFVLRLMFTSTVIPTIAGMAFVLVVRMLATKYRWSLPKIHVKNLEPHEAEQKTPVHHQTNEPFENEKKAS